VAVAAWTAAGDAGAVVVWACASGVSAADKVPASRIPKVTIPGSKAIEAKVPRAVCDAGLRHLRRLRILSFTVPRFKLIFVLRSNAALWQGPRLDLLL
jgi:hypothetical protein